MTKVKRNGNGNKRRPVNAYAQAARKAAQLKALIEKLEAQVVQGQAAVTGKLKQLEEARLAHLEAVKMLSFGATKPQEVASAPHSD